MKTRKVAFFNIILQGCENVDEDVQHDWGR